MSEKKCDTITCNNILYILKAGLDPIQLRKYYSIKTSCGIAHICEECFNKRNGFENYPNALEHNLETGNGVTEQGSLTANNRIEPTLDKLSQGATTRNTEFKKGNLPKCPIYQDTICSSADICAADKRKACHMPNGTKLIKTTKIIQTTKVTNDGND